MAMQSGFRIRQWGHAPQREEFAIPSPGPGEVLIEVEACGVGLTVLNCINGNLGNAPHLLPRVPGHELVGRVVELGDGADPALVSRRVVAFFYLICGDCESCRAGHENRCRNLGGFVGVNRDGGYAPWVALPDRNAIPISDELDPVAATVIPDAVATPVHVAARANIGRDDRVVVVGAGGGVGIHMVQVARHHGAAVAGFDVTSTKLAEIERFGALPVRSDDLEHLSPGIFGGDKPTVVADLVGTVETAAWALQALDTGGRLVTLTTFPNRRPTFEPRAMVFRELSILGSRYTEKAQVAEAAGLVAAGHVEPVIGATAGPEDVLGIHDDIRSQRLNGRGALDWR